MAVWVSQSGDDLERNEYILSPMAGESDRDLLNRKAESAYDKGWLMVWSEPDVLIIQKHYPGGITRHRIFEIRYIPYRQGDKD